MFSSLTDVQVSGLIALLVSTPFLIKSVRNLYLASASKQWPKVSGTIKMISEFGKKYSLRYEYTVNRAAYKGCKICFTNTIGPTSHVGAEFEEKYAINRIVDVFYNPKDPKQSVLEPGKKDGLLIALIFLGILFIFGCLAVVDQSLFLELSSP